MPDHVDSAGEMPATGSAPHGKQKEDPGQHGGETLPPGTFDPSSESGQPAHAIGPSAPAAEKEAASAPAPQAGLEFLSPPQQPGEIGRLGQYRILKVLGTGGMGMVFLAEDCQLRRLVALKVMRPEVASSLTSRHRFLREARATAALQHDHIVNIFQVGQEGDVAFFAMQLLRGETLDDRLRREGSLPVREVVRIGREIAEGLAAAHAHGLVHRDIKPSNIWLEEERGRVKILDFGLARAMTEDARLTQSGIVMGTPAYMSPEQALGQPLDPRSDLFSLGCVLYRMCTGAKPFADFPGLAHLLAPALPRVPPPGEINPDVPAELAQLVMNLLAKDPANRPPSARVVAATLERMASGTSSPPGRRLQAGAAEFSSGGLQPVPLPAARRGSEETRLEHPFGSAFQRTEQDGPGTSETYLSQLRLFLEELGCDFCRFEHVVQDGLAPESIRIDREYDLGSPGAYADIRVAVPGCSPYFVEVKYGYSGPRLLESFRRKFSRGAPALADAARVVLIIDCERRPDWQRLEGELIECLPPHLGLEVWGEMRLIALLRDRFGVTIGSVTEDNLLEVRQAIDRAKGFHAFGTGEQFANYENDPLRWELIWHFGFWRLRQLREAHRLTPRDVLPPGGYPRIAVLSADLCSFTDYVRDTRDDAVIRDSLTTFYSKARYQIVNNGGMVYHILEDEVVALFGIPDHQPGYLKDALRTAEALRSIGQSVSNHWQRHIDRVQAAAGLHIGMALGDLQVVSLRPFSRTHMGAYGDSLKLARKLLAMAGPSEIVVSNSFYQALPEEDKAAFQETASTESRGIGRIQAWKLCVSRGR